MAKTKFYETLYGITISGGGTTEQMIEALLQVVENLKSYDKMCDAMGEASWEDPILQTTVTLDDE